MGVFTEDIELPGVITEIIPDYSFGFDGSQFGSTDSVLVLGTAFNGPTNRPIPIYNPEHGYYVFGKAYDNTTRQEATLVKGIEDAYQRGCRTIYGMRVSGKNAEKKFKLAHGDVMLKVRSVHPSREIRDCYMIYDDSLGDEKIKIYKPESKAVIEEKMFGMVEDDESVIELEINLNADFNINRNTDISEAMELVNKHNYNNVLRLSLVDRNGIELLPDSEEARNIKLGSMLPGAYLIGRDSNLCEAYTEIEHILAEDSKPFEDFEGATFRRLLLNTDVTQPYPIYAQDYSDLVKVLRKVQVSTSRDFDFFKKRGLVDRAWKKDKIDYEEVNLSDYELYERLGSGFATTATVELRTSNGKEVTPRVKEAPLDDPNRVKAIHGGIYNILESHGARYRVLNCGYADKDIKGKMPSVKDFLEAMPETYRVLDGFIEATTKIEPEAMYEPKSYRFDFISISPEVLEQEIEEARDNLFNEQTMSIVPQVNTMSDLKDKKYENGTLVLYEDKLYRYTEGSFKMQEGEGLEGRLLIANSKIYEGKKDSEGKVKFELSRPKKENGEYVFNGKRYVLAETNDVIYVMKVVGQDVKHVEFAGDAETFFAEQDEKFMVFAPSNYIDNNRIVVKYNAFDAITLEELVEVLNEHPILSTIFDFQLSSDITEEAAEFVSELTALKEVQEDMLSLHPTKPFKEDNLIFENGIVNINLPAIDSGYYNVEPETGKLYFSNQKGPQIKPENEFNYRPSSEEPEYAYVPFVVELPEEYKVNGLLYTFDDYKKVPGTLQHYDERENTAVVDIRVAAIKERPSGKEDYSITDWELMFSEHKVEIIAEREGEEENFMLKSQIKFDDDRRIAYNYSKYIPYKTSDNFVRQLAQHCTYTGLKTSPTHGIVGHLIVSDRSFEAISKLVDRAMNRSFDLYAKNHKGRNLLDRDNMPYHIGRNVSVTLVQYPITTRSGYELISNGAAGYAGMASVLPLDRSSTNHPINVQSPQFRFNNYDLKRLTQKGYVTLHNSYTAGLVVTDGVTMAPPESPFKRLSVTRVISGVEDLIREATEPFIGKQNSPANRNAMHTAIKSKLESVKGVLIETYKFNMIADPRTLRFSMVDIDYQVIPVYEIRQVRNRITVRDTAE